MIKLFSLLMIVSSFACAGFYFSSLQKQRVCALKNILTMLSQTENQLRYLKITVADLMNSLKENDAVLNLGFAERCIELMDSGTPFSDAWKTSIEENRHIKRLLPETYNSLLLLGNEIGSTDLEGQLSSCEYYKTVFGNALCEREEISRKSAKLCPSLGLLLGISAAIMLI